MPSKNLFLSLFLSILLLVSSSHAQSQQQSQATNTRSALRGRQPDRRLQAGVLPSTAAPDTLDQLFVQTLTGLTTRFTNVETRTTIGGLKETIEENSGIPADHQILVFAGRQLEDRYTLADYSVFEEATLFLVIAVPDTP